MSVYTLIERAELEAYLRLYNVGNLQDYQGIESGIENTNYFVTTDTARFVLTIFEQHTREELPFFLDLTAFLSEHDITCAHPEADLKGRYLGELKGKPAALVQRLEGQSVDHPETVHCAAVGQELARMHSAGVAFPQTRANPRGPHWWRETISALDDHISDEDKEMLHDELAFQASHSRDKLPRGIVHADLFRDNVLFSNTHLSGFIDFYYACTDALVYDLAVTVNDWCTDQQGNLESTRLEAMLNAYRTNRELGPSEQLAWPVMLRAGALRFWLSRLFDMHFPRPGEMTHTKDPDVFRRILVHHRSQKREI